MKNSEITRIFGDIATLMEIKDESFFKVRAYTNAKLTIEELQEEVQGIYDRGGLPALQELPFIGQATAKKIEELLKTGVLAFYERLKESVPAGLIEVMTLPGLGPKTVRLLHEKLEITSLDDLKRAVEQHKVRELPGLGAKTEEKIARRIAFREKRDERPRQ
jgi:DNA polymerase (family 10)